MNKQTKTLGWALWSKMKDEYFLKILLIINKQHFNDLFLYNFYHIMGLENVK